MTVFLLLYSFGSSVPDARQDERELATDNAVSALGNLLETQRDSLGGAEGVGRAWELWLGYMPLRADEEEAEKVGFVLYPPLKDENGVEQCLSRLQSIRKIWGKVEKISKNLSETSRQGS